MSHDPQDHPAPGLAGLADLRVTYSGTLDESSVAADPLTQFASWFADARATLPEPNAMVLATADPGGRPSARTVLLKAADARGFVFYTNLGSRKGREIAGRSAVSLVFPWFAMHRQVVVVGAAVPVSRAEAGAYFDSRPRESRLGAWASQQSEVIDGRAPLERRYEELSRRWPEGTQIPLPDFWGGFVVVPGTVEFWAGRPSRLHDRLEYGRTRDGADMDDPLGWTVIRRSP